jgi:hypothetical protein
MLNVIIFDMYDPMKHIDKLMKVKIEAYWYWNIGWSLIEGRSLL